MLPKLIHMCDFTWCKKVKGSKLVKTKLSCLYGWNLSKFKVHLSKKQINLFLLETFIYFAIQHGPEVRKIERENFLQFLSFPLNKYIELWIKLGVSEK